MMEEQEVSNTSIKSDEGIAYLRRIDFPVNACWEELARYLGVPSNEIDGARIQGNITGDYAGALENCLDWLIHDKDGSFSIQELEEKAHEVMFRDKLTRSRSGELFNLDRAFRLMSEANVSMTKWPKYAQNLGVPMPKIQGIKRKFEGSDNHEGAFYECCEYWSKMVSGEKSMQSIVNAVEKVEEPAAKRFKRAVRRSSSLCNEDSIPPEAPEIIEKNFMTMCSEITNPLSYAVEMYDEYLLTKGEFEECISQLIPYVDKFPNLRLISLLNAVFQSAGRCAKSITKPSQDAITYFIRMLKEDGVKCAEELKQQYEKMHQEFEKEFGPSNEGNERYVLEVDVSKHEISAKFQELMENFRDTVSRVVERVIQSVSIETIKEFLIADSHQNDQLEIHSLESKNDIEEYLIKEALHTKSTAQLECIAAHFKIKKATKELMDYIKKKKKLSERTTLKDFAKLIYKEEWVKTRDSQIIFKVSWDDKATIKKFEEFLNDAFGKLAPYITVRGVKQSIITIICTLPQWLNRAFRRMLNDLDDAYLESKGVIEVTLNDEILYPRTRLSASSISGIHHEKPEVTRQFSIEEDVFSRQKDKPKVTAEEELMSPTHHISETERQLRKLISQLQTERKERDEIIAKRTKNEMNLREKIKQLEKENEELKTKNFELKKQNTAVIDVPEASEDSNKIYSPPVKLRMRDFSSYLDNRRAWFSCPFYTHSNGYKMCLRVVPSGLGEGEGKYVSVHAHLMKGDYDDTLPWPFVGSFKLHLLNQINDRQHFFATFDFDADGMDPNVNSRVTAGKITPGGIASEAGHGLSQFIRRTELEYNDTNNTEYLKNDSVVIQVTNVTVHSTNVALTQLPWEKDKPLKTTVITMPNFSKYKEAGTKWLSQPFESHSKGYQFILMVFANGCNDSEGKSVSVYVHLTKGEHDDELAFPFTGQVCVRLLNLIDDSDHVQKVVPFDDRSDEEQSTRVRPTSGYNEEGLGFDDFLEHGQLGVNPNTNTQYLDKEDSLNFTIPWVKVD